MHCSYRTQLSDTFSLTNPHAVLIVLSFTRLSVHIFNTGHDGGGGGKTVS
jgi:hypothetical protein